MIGKSMRWERFSMKVNTDSRKVNTDSRKWGKSVHVQQESVFTFSRNGCSHWAGMGVQLQREYADNAVNINRCQQWDSRFDFIGWFYCVIVTVDFADFLGCNRSGYRDRWRS